MKRRSGYYIVHRRRLGLFGLGQRITQPNTNKKVVFALADRLNAENPTEEYRVINAYTGQPASRPTEGGE